MLVSYIELDSTYRNRDQYPIQSKFDALIYTCDNDDPISLSTPIVEWNGNNVTINGTAGVWIEDFPSQVGETIEEIDMLLWQNGEYVLSIQSNHLSMDDVIKLAESLKQ